MMPEPEKPVFHMKLEGFEKQFQTGFSNFLKLGDNAINARYDKQTR